MNTMYGSSIIPTLLLLVFAFCKAQKNFQLSDDYGDIFFRLYARNGNINEYIDAPLLEVRNLVALLDFEKATIIYLHGYTGSIKSKDVITVISAYLERMDHNVMAVDWRRIAGQKYPNVVSSAQGVGYALAEALNEMVDQGLPKNNIHVVGHSMGAQVAGFLGRQTSFELTRITGLDPAGPFFNFLEAHLSAADARFVDTIHTDAGFYGIGRASGCTVSFYPNGGRRVQPGCPTKYEFSSPEDYCSHHRSFEFYAESLRDENAFVGTNCTSFRKFSQGECDGDMKIPMGYATPIDATGVFYLITNNGTPYGMRMEGAVSKRALNNNMLTKTELS